MHAAISDALSITHTHICVCTCLVKPGVTCRRIEEPPGPHMRRQMTYQIRERRYLLPRKYQIMHIDKMVENCIKCWDQWDPKCLIPKIRVQRATTCKYISNQTLMIIVMPSLPQVVCHVYYTKTFLIPRSKSIT